MELETSLLLFPLPENVPYKITDEVNIEDDPSEECE